MSSISLISEQVLMKQGVLHSLENACRVLYVLVSVRIIQVHRGKIQFSSCSPRASLMGCLQPIEHFLKVQ